MARDDHDKINQKLSPLMEALGNVAHHWAKLEYEINQMVWALAAVQPADGACITSQIPSIVPRLRALISLAHEHGASKSLIKGLNSFSGRADALARRRNRVIHDPWFFREYPNALIEYGRLEVTADRRLTFEIKPQSRQDVLDIAHDIIAATKEFRELRAKIHDELKEQLESRLGKSLEDYLRLPILGIAP